MKGNAYFNFMAIVQKAGPIKMTRPIGKTASTAFTENSVVTTTSGLLTTAANTELGLLGIIPRAVVATDSDYASETPLQLIKFHDEAIFEIDVQGTLTTAMVGEAFDLYSSTGVSLDIGNNTYKQFIVVGFVSASKALVKPNMAVLTP